MRFVQLDHAPSRPVAAATDPLSAANDRRAMSDVVLLPGWYEVSGGRSLHRVIDGGHRKMRTTCGLGVRAVFGCNDRRHRRCQKCERIDNANALVVSSTRGTP